MSDENPVITQDAGKTAPVTTPAPASPANEDDIEGLKRQNKALLTELANKKEILKSTSEELNTFKTKQQTEEEERLRKNGESDKAYELQKQKNESMQQKLIRAELKAVAAKEGIMDLDAVALIDTAKIKISDSLEISGVEDAVKAFKEAKPAYFPAMAAATANAASPAAGQKPTGAPVATPSPNPPAKITEGINPNTPEAKKVVSDWQNKFRK